MSGGEAAKGFVCLVTEVDLRCAAEPAFAFVTNPSRWSRWHPATVAVRGVEDRPLALGETVVETIGAAGRRFEATWTVRVCEPPRRWVIETTSDAGDARIEYRLEPSAGGGRLTRLLWFGSQRAPWRRLDRNLTRRLLARQSRRAPDNLQRLLGGSRAPPRTAKAIAAGTARRCRSASGGAPSRAAPAHGRPLRRRYRRRRPRLRALARIFHEVAPVCVASVWANRHDRPAGCRSNLDRRGCAGSRVDRL